MNKTLNKLTTSLFANKENAEKAYQYALSQGYSEEDVWVLMSKESRKKYYDSPLVTEANLETQGTRSLEGLGIGSFAGITLGGIISAVAAMGTTVLFPGLELIIAGPIAAGLAGAGAGSIAGGVVGALVGFGIPEELAKRYEVGLQAGGIVLGVNEDIPGSNLKMDWNRKLNTY